MRIVYIFGTAYCGSSLLNLLLDGHGGARGLGECWGVRGTPRVVPKLCLRCGSYWPECEFYDAWDRTKQSFYDYSAEKYGCDVLVDSSKTVDHLEPGVTYVPVVLSKLPHEIIHSRIRHIERKRAGGQRLTPEMEQFVAADALDQLRWYADWHKQLLDSVRGDILFVPYREMAARPADCVRRVCDALDLRFSPQRIERWFDTDTHVFGGNYAVAKQTTGAGAERLRDDREWLGGKYDDKDQRIFVDEEWRRDAEFVERMARAYDRRRARWWLGRLLARLGHDSFDAARSDLGSAV